MYTRSIWRKVKQIIADQSASTTAEVHTLISSTNTDLNGNPFGLNFDITIMATTGNVNITFSTAVASTAGFPILEHQSLDLKVNDKIYLCAGSTAPRFTAIVWEK